jgi:hypothetical protein
MSYQYVTFDGVSLPLFDHSQEHAPMQAEPTLVDSIGGAYDWVGTARRKGRKQIISLTGVYFGETTFLVDELGNFIVDDLAAFLIAGDSYQMAQAQVVALLEKKGVRGQLWRKRLGVENSPLVVNLLAAGLGRPRNQSGIDLRV